MMETFKNQIDETLIKVGRMKGYLQNEACIYSWCKDGLINFQEASFLRRYNKEIAG